MLPSDSSIQLFRPKEILTFLASTNACFSDLGTQAYNHFFSWPSRQGLFTNFVFFFFGDHTSYWYQTFVKEKEVVGYHFLYQSNDLNYRFSRFFKLKF